MKELIYQKLQKFDTLYIVDVGHHKGCFIQKFKMHFPNKKFFVVAIDPINYNSGLYDLFFQVAISTKTSKSKFNIYDEPGCNSLKDMKLENLTRAKDQGGWFCNHNINKIKEIEVDCSTLEDILNPLNLDIIHFLKVDAQGSDLDVVLSAGESIKKCIFIQIESCTSVKADGIMYEGQTNMEKDIQKIENLGFKLIEVQDHSAVSCPEADLIFINTDYLK